MKNNSPKQIVACCLILFAAATSLQGQVVGAPGWLTYPFSQLVLRNDWAAPIVWKYQPFKSIIETETVISPPKMEEDWASWYSQLKAYQSYMRQHLNDTATSYLEVNVKKGSSVRLTYKRVLNDIRLMPGDHLVFNGFAQNEKSDSRFIVGLILIKKGQELSHNIIQSMMLDSMDIKESLTHIQSHITIPDFDTRNLVVQPAIFFATDDTASVKIDVHGLTFSIPDRDANLKVYNQMKGSFYPQNKGVDRQLYDRPENKWIKSNFISGFAYLWDSDFWDADKKVFTPQLFCDKMKREFGGFQSVLIWIGYPNIGVDSANIWDIINAIPGGTKALRDAVAVFHKNKMKVYFPFMPWEIDTRRATISDSRHWGEIIGKTDADGLFFDTWFDGDSFQKELDKYKKGVSIGTEHHPTLQNVQGYNAITTSWGQTLTPYNNNGISRVKWLVPDHLQWTINRWSTNRQNNMAYSWINGQGILVWENIFGHMNPWNAKDRQTIRKINAIYHQFGTLYISDSWKPYLPTGNAKLHMSSWEDTDIKIWNIVTDEAGAVEEVEMPVSDAAMDYYDCWNGKKLVVSDGKVTVQMERFGCVIAVGKHSSIGLDTLLRKQFEESMTPLPALDNHVAFLSTKIAKPPPPIHSGNSVPPANLLAIKGGGYNLVTKGVHRESGCFPDADASNNNDVKIEKNEYGKEVIVHHTKMVLPDFSIMPRAVTNKEFENFIQHAGYTPTDKVNYLKHWHGKTCPDSIKDKPVVYVTLEDARCYAKWAGMRLPTEWEWQVAAETKDKNYRYNEVFEWNESERFDGNNHFVTLRGGCAAWATSTSRWYFPGAYSDKAPGGVQPMDYHQKYFIMYAGFDRAATLGFRCLR